ncbi:hypothetical protein [Spongiactinospora sp. TRM90649]|uniref:hypothetical protein n=1 Tax=Spongiactinospora sp. TRM90649 TaxID=3031114 RepID=UPI0023F632C4|nr:hypothetical protein [Spongiactinospora sp. TRM90649]MDF5755891.1 hypothetical protein [Spongiactinospora sp. TRM90649]
MTHSPSGLGPHVVLVPDLGEELASAVRGLEVSLLALRAAERAGAGLPGPLADGVALGALRRLWRSVAPTQGRRANAARLAGRLFAPGRAAEHVPLRLVDIDPLDVVTLSAAAAVLGRSEVVVREALESVRAGHERSGMEESGPASVAARFSGMLDLADTAESVLLRERLGAAGPGADVVLTPAEEAAYRATLDRITTMWTAYGSPR